MPTIYNKVVIDGDTLMDISDTTAVASDVASGKYFYTANGTKTAGTASGGGSSATLITKTIAANGTYSAQDDSADGYSSVTVNVPSSGITPTGSINITTNGTHDVTNYASAVVNVPTSGGGGSSATQHTIGLTLWDDTTATIPVYYDDSLLNTIITSFKPTMYNNKQIAQASLDNVIWYNPPVRIPLNTQLIDFTKVKEHYGLDEDGAEEAYEWSSVTDYIRIDPNMTFSIINYRWFSLYFYDTNKIYINAMQAQSLPNATIDENDDAHGTLTSLAIPSNAEYLRLLIHLGADDTNASVIRIG